MPIKYKDDGLIKRPNKKMQFTTEQIQEIVKCTKDITYFAEKYFTIITPDGSKKIKLYDYQKQLLKSFTENQENIVLSSRQSGKTTTVGIFLVWFAFFNSEKTIGILAHKADMAKAILAEIKYAIEEMPEFLKPGVVEYNAFNIKFDNKCEIIAKATSANSLRGETIHLLLLDEFAFVPNNIALDFWNTTYPTLSTSKGKCIIVSTPNGTSNLYYDLWKKALDGRNTFKNIRIDWWQVPGRDEVWKEKTIKNLGSLVRFNQEFGNSFIGSTVTLIDGRFITEKLKAEPPIFESKDGYTKVWKEPQKGRKYLFSIDTGGGVGSDSSIIDVYDITDFPNGGLCEQVAIYQNNTISPPAFAQYVFDSCEDWNNPYIVGELNGLSAQVIDRLFNDYEYENLYYDYDDETFGLTADKKSKPQAAVWYKEYLETGRIKLKNGETINQIGYFEEVKPGVYKAKEGRNNHDDCVMTGLWASYFLKSKFFEDEMSTWDYKEEIDEEAIKEEEKQEAEEALSIFLEQDAIEYGENWLEDEEMAYYKRQKN